MAMQRLFEIQHYYQTLSLDTVPHFLTHYKCVFDSDVPFGGAKSPKINN